MRMTVMLGDAPVAVCLHPSTGNKRTQLALSCPLLRDWHFNSVFPAGICLWNQLPKCTVTSLTLVTLKGTVSLSGHARICTFIS